MLNGDTEAAQNRTALLSESVCTHSCIFSWDRNKTQESDNSDNNTWNEINKYAYTFSKGSTWIAINKIKPIIKLFFKHFYYSLYIIN